MTLAIPRGGQPFDSREPNPPRATQERRVEVLDVLPDSPEFVECVGMLRSGRCDVVEAEAHGDGVCIVHDDQPLVAVLGEPGARAIRYALASLGDDAELIALNDNVEHVQEALPTWVPEAAVIHALPDAKYDALRWRADELFDGRRPAHAEPRAGVLCRDDLPSLRALPFSLGDELREAIKHHAVSAVWPTSDVSPGAPGPVAFCYAHHATPTLWDVSVDCHVPFRRKGFATAAFLHQLKRLHPHGLRPVWGALLSNRASLTFADRLGFEPVGRLYVFTRAED